MIRTPEQADPWQVIADVASALLEGGQDAATARRNAIGALIRNGIDIEGSLLTKAFAAREPQPAPLSALGVRSGELTVDEVQELRGKLEASLAQPAPELAAAMTETRQKLDDALDDFLFERQQVVELRTVLGEIFTCLAAGDPALLDDDQVFEWRERAGLPS